jgi:hypothetical protein
MTGAFPATRAPLTAGAVAGIEGACEHAVTQISARVPVAKE